MRFNISVLLIIISLSCNPPVRKNTAITGSSSTYRYDSLEGAYTGDFGGSNIRIILTHVTGKHAIGYNLLKGLRRNISGTMQQNGSSFTFLLNEPGDHPFDGKFNFSIDTTTFVLSGTWTPLNDKSLSIKTFTLKNHISAWSEDLDPWRDSIGDFTFAGDGVCIYEFYPVINGKSAEQLIRVKGTWSKKDSLYTVDWEPNTVFPSRKSIFVRRIVKQDSSDYEEDCLIGEGRTLSQEP